jgi:CubicO group peptidase (beta-lactamase class C family)
LRKSLRVKSFDLGLRRTEEIFMKRTMVLGSLLLYFAASIHAQADNIDRLMQHAMIQAHIPGAAVAVIRNGKVIRTSYYGTANTEYNIPVKPETPFQIASTGKIYTAALLMRMVEEHKLGLDESVTKYVPDAPATWNGITIRNLVSHASGLASVQVDPNVVATADVIRLAFKTPVIAQPGERAQYDSFDFTMLQYIMEKASGKSFAQLTKDELFAPANMTCSAFDNAEEHGPQRFAIDIPGRAEYYRWLGKFNQRRWFLYTQYAYAAGGVYSCAADMATFLAEIDSGKLLSRSSLAEIETPARMLDGSTAIYGVGWVVGHYRGHRWIGHSGGPAFSDVMYFPDDHLGIVVFTNQQKLHPIFASLIADQFISAPTDYTSSSLPDNAPTLTSSAQKLLEGAAAGALDASLIAPAKRDDYVDDLNDIGPAWFGLFGPVSRMILSSDTTSAEGNRVRRYRVLYGEHVQGMTFTFDKNGKIVDIDPEGD